MEKKIKSYSEQHNMSKSDVVKEALAKYFTKEDMKDNPFALGADLFGVSGSGEADRSINYKSKLKSKIGKKHNH